MLRSRYLRVRFEDVAGHPEALSHVIFRFIRVPLHPDVRTFIRNSTNTTKMENHGKDGEGSDPRRGSDPRGGSDPRV